MIAYLLSETENIFLFHTWLETCFSPTIAALVAAENWGGMKMNQILQATLGAAALFMVIAVPASAAHIDPIGPVDGLTLDPDPEAFYQQSAINPCVIGPRNCLNGGFNYTLAGSGGGGSVFERESPVYSVATITGVVGTDPFTVGLDFNQTVNAQTLFEFRADYLLDGVVQSSQTWITNPDTILQVNNNGVGFSDFLLSGFMIDPLANQVQFYAEWFNNDGADRFFLIAGEGPTECTPGDPECPVDSVPEPGSMILLGIGLLGAGAFTRRRNRK